MNFDLTAWTPGTTTTVAYTASSAATGAALGAQTTVYRIAVTTACFMAYSDATLSATTAGVYLPAGSVEYFRLPASSFVAFIRATADGSAYITEMTR